MFSLAETLGMPVAELAPRLTVAELAHWVAYRKRQQKK